MPEATAPTRKYTISIDIEVRDQDDFQHFQPDTVVGRAPQLGIEWVGSNDREALRNFFAFFIHPRDLVGMQEIVLRAYLRESDDKAAREIVQAVATAQFPTDEDGDFTCPWCIAWPGHSPDCPVTKARAILAKSEGSTNGE